MKKVPNSSPDEPNPQAGDAHVGGPRLALMVVAALVVVACFFTVYWFLPGEEVPPPPAQGESPLPVGHTVELPTAAVEISNEDLQADGVAEIEKLQKRFPDNPAAMHVAAMLYAGLRQTEKAEEIWRRSIALDSRYVGPRTGLASVLTERGEDDEAVRILSEAIADRCASPETYYTLAEVLTKLGRLDEAEKTLQDGLKLFPQVANLWFLLGQTQNQRQQYVQAEASLLKAIQYGYGSPTVYFTLSNACVRQGKKDEAARYRKQFSEMKAAGAEATEGQAFHERYGKALRPLVASSLAGVAAVYEKANEPGEAERLFLKTLALIPENLEVLRELASFYLRTERPADARVILQRLVELDPTGAIDLMNLASVSAQLGDFAGAEKTLRQVIELNPKAALPRIALAQLLLQAGNFQEARTQAESSIRAVPTAQGYGILAAAAQALGDQATARSASEMAQRLSAGAPPQSVP